MVSTYAVEIPEGELPPHRRRRTRTDHASISEAASVAPSHIRNTGPMRHVASRSFQHS